MSDPTNLLFVGLPRSGKTTYLAALWHVLEDQSSATKLRLSQLSGDRTYLNLIVEAWRACKPVPRTTLQAEAEDTTVTLHLEGDGFGGFTLAVPDLSGEAFDQQLEHRKMTVTYADLLRRATGVILFVHPDVKKGTQISEQDQIAASIGGTAEAHADGPAVIPVAWKVELLPTQTKLVELLQFVLDSIGRRLRVAVVVSAWDLIEDVGSTPHEYLSKRMPLLRQFLDANDDVVDHAVFGVSAQGGAIPADKSKLLELDSLKRVRVLHGTAKDHDITRPLAWLLGSK